MVGHEGIAPSTSVWKTGVYLSTLMPGKWSPVRESHPAKRFCKPPPELLGQRDEGNQCMFDAESFEGVLARHGKSSDNQPTPIIENIDINIGMAFYPESGQID